jgi:hypothetical protein
MWDELVAYALMGGADEATMVEILTHSLSEDLCPEVRFLRVEDVQTLARMEVSLLTGPPRALRAAAGKLAALRAARLASGESVSDDEVGRIMMDAIASYRADRAIADREREGRIAAERDAGDLRERIQVLGQKVRDGEAAQERLKTVSAKLDATLVDSSSLRADLKEVTKRQDRMEEQRKEDEKNSLRRRDWMLFSAVLLVVALLAFLADVSWAGYAIIAFVVGCVLWSALAQETPKASLKILTATVALIAGIAGAIEKVTPLRAMVQTGQADHGRAKVDGQSDVPVKVPPP